MRWNLMTILTDAAAMSEERSSRRHRGKEAPQPVTHVKSNSTATEALDRIQFPKEAIDRISEILTPGSWLVLPDSDISGETGKGTDFIVLTRDRRPPSDQFRHRVAIHGHSRV
jgi:hypothetical protein